MSAERLLEVKERLFHLERKIRPLEWDSLRNQINEYKKKELQRLKEEHKNLSQELNALEQSNIIEPENTTESKV